MGKVGVDSALSFVHMESYRNQISARLHDVKETLLPVCCNFTLGPPRLNNRYTVRTPQMN
jgi:hypothetical protein